MNLSNSESFPKVVLDFLFKHKGAPLPIFEKMVDFGDICTASKMLFADLSATKNYNKAIYYMVSSPMFEASKKYHCGDESLELLLN